MRARNALVSFRLEKETLYEHPLGFPAFLNSTIVIRILDYLSPLLHRRRVVSSRFDFPPPITLIARVPRTARSIETRVDLTIDKCTRNEKTNFWCLKRVRGKFLPFLFPLYTFICALGIFFFESFFFNLINDIARRFFFFLNHPVYKHIMKRERVFQMCIQACCSLTYRFTHQHSSAYLASSVS